MGSYSIGNVERLLGVRAHVLRYWEREVPLLSPAKGQSGRREYTETDIALLLRLKHFLYALHMSLDDASDALERERACDPDTSAAFSQMRASLIRAYFQSADLRLKVENFRVRADTCHTDVPQGALP